MKKQKGQALTEFVLVCGLFTLILMGIWQIGRMLLVKQRQVMALRHGAWLKAHTNLSHKNIEKQMKRFMEPDKNEIVSAYIGNSKKDEVFAGQMVLDDMFSKFSGQYCASVGYRLRVFPYLSPIFGRNIYLNEDLYMVRNSWAGMEDTVKEKFKIKEN